MNTSYQVMPPLTDEEFTALKADIAVRGLLVPVEKDDLGNILDGHHRARACEELGITDYPVIVRTGMSESEKRIHARVLNCSRRHLTSEQKRLGVAEQLRETPEKSNREIGRILGVDHKTVGSVRESLLATGEIPQLMHTVGADGRSRSTTRALSPSENLAALLRVHGEVICTNLPDSLIAVAHKAEGEVFQIAVLDIRGSYVDYVDRGFRMDKPDHDVVAIANRNIARIAIENHAETFKPGGGAPDSLEWEPTTGGIYAELAGGAK